MAVNGQTLNGPLQLKILMLMSFIWKYCLQQLFVKKEKERKKSRYVVYSVVITQQCKARAGLATPQGGSCFHLHWRNHYAGSALIFPSNSWWDQAQLIGAEALRGEVGGQLPGVRCLIPARSVLSPGTLSRQYGRYNSFVFSTLTARAEISLIL